ncbi:MAG: helix-hairpin-helix domain-containing protein [Clostridiales bacterium]|jgi:comEA protein|nr:helix-hairpin-helix domain-containing protein [Clostridiales bacterium]
MRHRRYVYIMIIAAVLCVSFSAGFLLGRRTGGGTFTISTERRGPEREDFTYDISIGVEDANISGSVTADGGAATEDLYININTCSIEQLLLLPSIGATKASQIIEYREENGPFRSIADIMQVNGIGQSTYDKIKQFIYVHPQ